MKPWLEDLSEEWVVQPAPSAEIPQANSPSATPSAQSAPSKPRSLIPRMRRSSTSFSEISLRQIAKDLKPSKPRNALAARTLSDNNIPPSSDAVDPTQAAYTDDSLAASLSDSVVHNEILEQGSVVRSPQKEQPEDNAPEWRRRLLQGDVGYKDQKDLFSPMGLENIFQKPNGESSEKPQQRKSKLGLLKGLGPMPSSPPPWPSSEYARGQDRNDEGPTETMNQSQDLDAPTSEIQDRDTWVHDRTQDSAPRLFSSDPSHVTDQPRTVSGQIEFENENFSPVDLSMALHVGTQPSAIPSFTGSQLAHRLRRIGSPPPTIDIQPASNDNSNHESRNDSSYTKLHDDSLPEDLPAGTPDLADIGRFVEMRRGGYSRDGSFRRRGLSPSPEAKLASRRLPPNATSPDEGSPVKISPKPPSPPMSPVTPRRRQQPERLSPERAQTSGSPLKLFDAHDTFTSKRLQRRLSQLEIRSEKTTTSDEKLESTKVVQQTSRLTSVEEASFLMMTTGVIVDESHDLETFGQGHLDDHEFPAQFTVESSQFSFDDESAPDCSPSLDVAPPGSRQPTNFQYDGSPQSRKASRTKRQGLTRVSNPLRPTNQLKRDQSRKMTYSLPHPKEAELPEQEYSEGKRGPTSPFKNPTPKRRRTLHSVDDSDDSVDGQGLVPVQDSNVAQSGVGRKRKDALHDQSVNVADPDVLARRHILRPRNPTPSQRRREEIQAEIMEATEAFFMSSPKLNTIREQLDSSIEEDTPLQTERAAVIANEVAEFNLHRVQPVRDETRKRSVTTQDFLDEAVKIMDYIRARGRPTSGLESLEETESEMPPADHFDALPSTPLSFSRPPTREGRLSAWREPNKHILDSNTINHLRKFQDVDSESFMGSSMPSFRIPQLQGVAAAEGNSIIVEQDNIRITDNLDRHKQTPLQADGPFSQPRTTNTHPSAGSLAQTVMTNISRRSDHVTTIAAERVAHLIPEQIAGMSFDREKNIWVRQKSPSREHRPGEDISNVQESSEEDPFEQIPDLSVNETEERMRNSGSPCRQQAMAETLLEDTEVAEENVQPRPVTREGRQIPLPDTSSIPSKASNFTWSFPKTETRATSWNDQETRKGSIQKSQQAPATYPIPESDEIDVEHEIRYFEGRAANKPIIQNAHIRDVTFSIEQHNFPEPDHNITSSPQKASPQKPGSSAIRQNHRATKPLGRGVHSLPHSRKPMKMQDGELSILEDLPTRNYTMQLSMSVAAPRFPTHESNRMLAAPSSPYKGDVTFMLSDLPDFTLNQVDECELPDRVVVKHDGAKFSKALEDRYALGTADLVKALQDVEPDEPYWEDLRELDLHGKDLANLYRLDEFCYRVESLDVSENNISHVKGIPFTVRRLLARENALTGLTSWASLMNLQHLDISGNEIDSLDGLGEHVHLRVLKIDNNKLESLDGIMHLDGLMELSASGNQISSVDFARANLKSITELNLRGNSITEVRNLHCLPQLQHLDLDDNLIKHFPHFDTAGSRCKSLRSLRLANNRLRSLNVESYCPSVESLYVDGNVFVQIHGLERLKRLRTLSAREQKPDASSLGRDGTVANLFRNSEVRNLYVSINPSHSLGISQHMLNLQRLELASMGLKELPEDFGQLAPNIRSINLNFNSIQDLRPLLNIKRLTELLVAGNKLGRLRTNLAVLGKLATLTKLDMRDNPLTLRFYAPAVENRIMSLRTKTEDEASTDRFVLPQGDADTDAQYLQRLDFETRLRRRVQEILLCTNCRNLTECDGLPFDRSRILVKDDVWERLLYLGIVKKMDSAMESFQSEQEA